MYIFMAAILCIAYNAVVGQQHIPPFDSLPATPSLPSARETGYVNLTNVDIWYAQFGPALGTYSQSANRPILFLHGGFANSDYFGHQVAYLMSHHVPTTIISIDSRMQGRSTGVDQPISYELMRDDVIGVLDHFNISAATIVGWSDGGIIGLDMAMNTPSRLHRLFAFGASYSYTNFNSTADEAPAWKAYLSRVKREYKQLSPTPNSFGKLNRKINNLFATLPDYNQSDFAKIPNFYQKCTSAPLVWIVDGADEEAINRDTPTTMHNWLPGSGLVILPSVSHFAFLQDPTTFNMMLQRFLDYDVTCTGIYAQSN